MVGMAATRRRLAPTLGNERLTALTGVALLVLLAVEGVTIVWLRPFLNVHLFVGLLLIPPVALKLASTGYRFVRYYTGDPGYRRRGPPHALLRWTAPMVVLSTVTVLASGVWLLLAGPRSRDAVLPVHKVSFIVWGVFTGVHVLGHVAAVPRAVAGEYRSRSGWRAAAVIVSLAVGVALAVTLLPHFHAWQLEQLFRHHHHERAVRVRA